jgi:hypothetical protein
LLLLASVAPVWSARFFVTGDGPCHVYNAHVLLDYAFGRHRDFYDPFYFITANFDPNWFGHMGLALFQLVFAPETAEKLFLTGYVATFGLGLRYLLRQINPQSVFLSSLGLLFVWHHLLMQGFYNYAASIAIFFWVCGYWLKYRDGMTPSRSLVFALLWLILYAAHPMGFAFACIFIACSMLSACVMSVRQDRLFGGMLKLGAYGKSFLLSALPALMLFAEYLYRKPPSQGENGETVANVWTALINLNALVTMNAAERGTAVSVGILVAIFALGAVALRIKQRKWIFEDFIVLFFGIALWQYFRQTGAHSIELLMPLRIQLFPWLALLLWAATAKFPNWSKGIVISLAIIAMTIFLYLRIPTHIKASNLVTEYVDCVPYIRDESVLLVLNYDFSGRDPQGREIANRTWLNIHATDYIGAYRTAIMSDNYEALRSYFPINWHWQRNMFGQTEKDGINFDHRPPRAEILSFNQRTGGSNIDYVLVANYDDQYRDHPYTKEIQAQLEEGYRLIYTSPMGKARLYQRK